MRQPVSVSGKSELLEEFQSEATASAIQLYGKDDNVNEFFHH